MWKTKENSRLFAFPNVRPFVLFESFTFYFCGMTIEHTLKCVRHQLVAFVNCAYKYLTEISEIFSILIEENFFPELLNSSELNSGNMSSYDGSQSPRSGGAMTPNSRNKRMRTSFKHHQLRTMKSYFAINQNPDAKDLKQLAQKTGLSKRVLQVKSLLEIFILKISLNLFYSLKVWFQNARAKWRRNVMRQDGGLQNPNCPQVIKKQRKSFVECVLTSSPQSLTSYASTEIHTPNSSESDMTPSHALEEMHNMSCMELY